MRFSPSSFWSAEAQRNFHNLFFTKVKAQRNFLNQIFLSQGRAQKFEKGGGGASI